MNAVNSGLPQGSFPGPGSLPGPARIKVAVFTVLGIHAVVLIGVLMQGCKQDALIVEVPATKDLPMNMTNAVARMRTPPKRAVLPPNHPSAPPAPHSNVASPRPVESLGSQRTKLYVVAEGDWFYKIAKAQGITPKSLAEANPGVDSTKLKIGQTLKLPEPQTQPASIE